MAKKMKSYLLLLLCVLLLCSCGTNQYDESVQSKLVKPEEYKEEDRVAVKDIKNNRKYVGHATQILSYPKPTTGWYKRVQGGCFVDDHFYVANFAGDGDGNMVVISVVDMEGNVVKESEPMDLDHANSITYVEKEDALYIANCQQEGDNSVWYRYSVVDRATLTLVRAEQAERQFSALSYSPEKDMFVGLRGGGVGFELFDGEMNHLEAIPKIERGSVSQGGWCDESGIWFVRSISKEWMSELLHYDWEGNLIHEILLPDIYDEAEDIAYIGETIYITGTARTVWEISLYDITNLKAKEKNKSKN